MCISVVYLQKSARQLQLLTNDLFRLEDKIDELNNIGVAGFFQRGFFSADSEI